jgi:hypothetical protein
MTISRVEIGEILQDAISAPSGENCQPWLLELKEGSLNIFNNPKSDRSVYSWGQRASLVAHGALIENIVLLALARGYQADIKFFPDETNLDHVAKINFIKTLADAKELASFVTRRHTNRKVYLKEKISQDTLESIEDFSSSQIKIQLTEEPDIIKELANIGALNEEIMLDNKVLHNFFFSHVSWTKEEDDVKKIGFFIDTLELPAPAKLGFKLFSKWERLQKIKKFINIPKFVAKTNAQVYASSAAIGVITISNKKELSYVEAGRVFERLWIFLTKEGISLQPLTGVLFMNLKVESGETRQFSDLQVKKIKEAYDTVKEKLNIQGDRTVALMFRIGKGGSPTAQSSKFKLEQVLK